MSDAGRRSGDGPGSKPAVPGKAREPADQPAADGAPGRPASAAGAGTQKSAVPPGEAVPPPGSAVLPPGGPPSAPGTEDSRTEQSGLTEDERAELVRLRAEAGKGQAGPPVRRRHRFGWRAQVASLLIFLGCVLAPLSVIAVWTSNQVSNTDRYVANVAPLISDPAIQRALTDKISTRIDDALQLQTRLNDAAALLTQKGLPRVGSLLNAVSGQVTGAVEGFIHTEVAKILASPQVANLWVRVNRAVHAQLVKALSGQGNGAITVNNGQVTLNLGPFINAVKKDLAAKGFTLVNQIPQINPTFALFSAKKLVQAQTAYRLITTLGVWLPIIALVLIGLGIYVARGHRRALLGAALGVAVSMLFLAAALAIFRSVYLNSVPSSVLPADAAAAAFDTLVRFVKNGLRLVLVVALLVAIGAFFTGPSATAVKTRRALSSGLGWVRGRGERAGLRTGPVGQWVYRYRMGLRIAAVAIAIIVFVFWSQPTGLVALVIAIVLLAVLGLIELIGRPPARPQVAGHPGSG